MSYFSTFFWVSFFMQDVQRLSSLQVGIRLLPQAVAGLILSPIIGFWMHKIPNQIILVAAALCQVGASVLLLFLRDNSNYFLCLFPSLILSTLSMDWVRNVGAVSLFSSAVELLKVAKCFFPMSIGPQCSSPPP